MKSGTGDDPFAESEDSSTQQSTSSDKESNAIDSGSQVEVDREKSSEPESPTIPYKFRRSSVKEDRKQRPIFLRPHIEDRESEFLRMLEDELGEDVYKTDALEAALVVAMDNPDLVAEELREWGYDWD